MIQVPKNKPIRLAGKKKKTLQLAVLERDNYTCQQCRTFTYNAPHHVIYRSRGGSDTLENMITLCGPLENDCHRKLHDGKIKLKGE